jgi:dUTPase
MHMGGFASKVVWGEGTLEDLNPNPLEDLVLPIEIGHDATLPDYPTTGSAGMQIFPSAETLLVPGTPTRVPTGIKMDLPYMLCAQIVGTEDLAMKGVMIHNDFLSCDSRQFINVIATLAPNAEPIALTKEMCVAHLVVMPVARPELQQHAEL